MGQTQAPRLRLSREHPRYERASFHPLVRQALQQVATVFGVEVSTVKKGRRGEANQARQVAMYLVKRLCDLTLQETATHFGVESYGVVGWACAQVRTETGQRLPLQETGRAGGDNNESTKDLTPMVLIL